MGSHGGRDTVEEKKSSSQPRPGAGGVAGLARILTLTLGLHTVQQRAAAPFLPARRRGEGKGKEGEEGAPLARTLAGSWTRIGCQAGKGRLLSVLTDPAALVPDRGGTVDQSHALSCRSTAHLVCNPHALPPWAPASLPTLPPTCSLMPSLPVSDGPINWTDVNLTVQVQSSRWCHTVVAAFFFSFFAFPLVCSACHVSPCMPPKDLTSSKLFDFRLATNDRPDTNKRTDGGRVSSMQSRRTEHTQQSIVVTACTRFMHSGPGPILRNKTIAGTPYHTIPDHTTSPTTPHHAS